MAVFLLIGKTSALTMNIAGVVKDWMLIGLSGERPARGTRLLHEHPRWFSTPTCMPGPSFAPVRQML